MSSTPVRVRFAPSPTGLLHIGGLRTALYNYLFARRNGGTFVLRIEDTDQKRYVADAEKDILSSLKWAGLAVDEGPEVPGACGPYRQSERSDLYRRYATELVASGKAYYAFDTPEEIEAVREAEGETFRYDAIIRNKMKNSLTLPEEEVQERLRSEEPYVIRLKVPVGETIAFDDLVRGHVRFDTSEVDDQVLMKSDGLPTYHLANVVDDHEMAISHVIRGEEWLPSAPKHVLLYRALGWTPPVMAHLPLIMSPAGGKLSKRKAEEQGIMVNVCDYAEAFYEPEALINFLALLGWNPGDERELFTLDELCEVFDLARVGKSGAVFNKDKLHWFNAQYLRAKAPESLVPAARYILEKEGLGSGCDDAFIAGVIRLMAERIETISALPQAASFFFGAPDTYEEKPVKKAWKENTADLVNTYIRTIDGLSEFGAVELKAALVSVVEDAGVGMGKLMLPVRIAVTGLGGGPDLFQTMQLLGKEEVISRLRTATEKLGS
ncbi:glutamyl-tRNA synthetase [Cyclonatronum proteinivorum]|uniref:Glutamate--tRNA ligase n=1 Tax=Cyclonatronum proteinivorum TaxID=1457365 RepID=A0A345UGN7_9BACT|nr:glutamate--tRNA ligase [Cyclonatronum proteinivorum]AXI99638.1 glutamyl-tRNA synthetase [Cyclonatronum proteinivorum]